MSEFTISRNNENAATTAPELIYNEGIARLIELSKDVWSDYNKHDPGITFLEVLSYLLTELQYKTDWPIQDILIDGVDDADIDAKKAINSQHFPAPDDILPSAALSTTDYRKLLIDIPKVNNAWLSAYQITLYYDSRDDSVTLSPRKGRTISSFEVSGGYRVKLLLAEGLNHIESRPDAVHILIDVGSVGGGKVLLLIDHEQC